MLQLSNDSIIRACLRKDIDFRPVWFMRQAGRYLPSYQKIRKKHDVITIAKNPELSSEVTVSAARELGVDAAVIFADIMLPLEPMGVKYRIEEDIGPIIANPVSKEEDVENIVATIHPENDLPFVLDAIKLAAQKLDDEIPIVGFSGAPFTLASYMIEGRPSRDFMKTKQFMYTKKDAWHLLMEKLAKAMVEYLKSQVKAGARVLQLFDSWVGCLSPADYEENVLPYSKKIFEEIRSLGVPSIHFGTNTTSLLELMTKAKSDVIGVDWRVDIDKAWKVIGEKRFGIQGNLEPAILLADDKELIEKRTSDILRRTEGKAGHIFNLGHGVLPTTPVENLVSVVRAVHERKMIRC